MKIIDINGKPRECDSILPDKKFPGNMKVNYSSKVRQGYKHSEWYPIDIFVKNNPTLKILTQTAPVVVGEDLGMVTTAGKNFIKDKTKNWKIGVYSDFPVSISRGKGAGQKRTVKNNTKNVLYIDKDWEMIPDKTSQYVLSANINYSIN